MSLAAPDITLLDFSDDQMLNGGSRLDQQKLQILYFKNYPSNIYKATQHLDSYILLTSN